jgi:hypothetical protein
MLNIIARGLQTYYKVMKAFNFSEKSQNFWEFFHFSLGFLGFHNLVSDYSLQEKEIDPIFQNYPLWQQKAFKTADLLGNLSLILGAMKSEPAITLWTWSSQAIFSKEQLERFFGAQSRLANHKVYRSIAIASFLFGVPSTLKTFYNIYIWIKAYRNKEEVAVSTLSSELDMSFQTPSVKKKDAFLTMQTVSRTATSIMRSSGRI